MTVNYTWANNESGGVDPNLGWWVPQVTNGSGNCEKYLTFYHQLTQKKYGSVRYVNPFTELESDTALTGHRREFIFIINWYKGGDSIGRNVNNDLLRGPIDIDVDVMNTTKFIDV